MPTISSTLDRLILRFESGEDWDAAWLKLETILNDSLSRISWESRIHMDPFESMKDQIFLNMSHAKRTHLIRKSYEAIVAASASPNFDLASVWTFVSHKSIGTKVAYNFFFRAMNEGMVKNAAMPFLIELQEDWFVKILYSYVFELCWRAIQMSSKDTTRREMLETRWVVSLTDKHGTFAFRSALGGMHNVIRKLAESHIEPATILRDSRETLGEWLEPSALDYLIQ